MHCMYTLTSYIDTNNITMITESNSMKNNYNEKTLRDANTASALAVVRFGVSPLGRPPVANTQTGPITIHCAAAS